MKKYDYLIVGAGIFGSVFAEQMTRFGKKCLVIEKESFPGGLAYTEQIENIDVHKFGAHIFHTSDKKVWDYVNSFASFNNFINSPLAVYKDKIYNLPFNMNTFSKMWNIKTPDEAKAIIRKQIDEYGVDNPRNLEEQAISMVGKDIYEILIKGYTEKQWGKKATELPAFIIKRLPVRYTYDNNYFNDRFQGVPEHGYTEFIKNILIGIEVIYNEDYFNRREYYNDLAETIVYTGPIDRYYDYCFGELEYRSLRFEIEILDIDNFQGNAVINYTEKAIPYTRIIEHKHFNPRPNQKKTVITKEYPESWNLDKKAYYPINDQKNKALFDKYNELAKKEKNIIFGGRLAEYKYYDMDKVIISVFNHVEDEKIRKECFTE